MTNQQSVDEGKVDVLAVIDRLREMIGSEYPERQQADAARAAVAELIGTMILIEKITNNPGIDYMSAHHRVNTIAYEVLDRLGNEHE